MTTQARSPKAAQGQRATAGDIVMLALYLKDVRPNPVVIPGESDNALAKALLACLEPAVRKLLGRPSHGYLRTRLNKLHGEIWDPPWGASGSSGELGER